MRTCRSHSSNREFCLSIILILSLLCLSLVVSLIVKRNDGYDLNFDRRTNLTRSRSNKFNISLKFSSHHENKPLEKYVRIQADEFQPIRYEIFFDLTQSVEVFSGQVIVSVMVLKTTNRLMIQASSLNITELKVWFNGSLEEVAVRKHWLDKSDLYIMETEANITADSCLILYLKYSGYYQGLGVILHQSTEKTLGHTFMTKFEPIHARKAFPCFDEPDMKARFKLSVKHDSLLTAYSNMPLEKTSMEDNSTTSIFQESPLMTTYLVVFVVCDCERSVSHTKRGLEIGIITLKEDSSVTEYASHIAVKSIEFFEQYLGIPYSFPKLDIFAAPFYPSFGMEHSGLIIQARHRILYQKDAGNEVYGKEWILYTTAHEIAHQWFGNLVTLKWWEHTWLNEGFATFFAIKALDYVDPGIQGDDMFLVSRYRSALANDLKGYYSAWNKTISSIVYPNQIVQAFSWLSYQKGGSLLRMMEDFIGEENMMQAIQSYLRNYADSNVETKDFTGEMQKVYDKINMTEFIDSWTKQSGTPIITVIRRENGTLWLRQASSLSSKGLRSVGLYHVSESYPDSNRENTTSSSTSSTSSSLGIHSEENVLWTIPVTYKTSEGSKGLIWLTEVEQEVSLDKQYSWILFNVGKKGYFSVNYSNDDWYALISALNEEPDKFTSDDFSGLLFDSYHLAESGSIEPEIFLNLLLNVKRHVNLAPLDLAITGSRIPFAAPTFGESRYLLNEFRKDLLADIYEKVPMKPTFREENYSRMIIRSIFLEDACEMRVQRCIDDSAEILESWIRTGSPIPIYLQSVVFRYGMSKPEMRQHWELLLNTLKANNLTNNIKGTALIKGVFSIPDENLREKALSLLKGTDYEIEAAILAETKCGSPLKTKVNPVKSRVIQWLAQRSEIGQPWIQGYWPKEIVMVPEHYQLNLSLTSDRDITLGVVTVTIVTREPSKIILFKVGPRLTVTSVKAFASPGEAEPLRSTSILNSFHYRRNEYFVVEFQHQIEPGYYLVKLEFTGDFKDAISADPKSRNEDSSSSSRYIELHGGRRLFPCFDDIEKNYNATFHVNVIYRSSDNSIELNSIGAQARDSKEDQAIFQRDVSWERQLKPTQLVVKISIDGLKLSFTEEEETKTTSSLTNDDNEDTVPEDYSRESKETP